MRLREPTPHHPIQYSSYQDRQLIFPSIPIYVAEFLDEFAILTHPPPSLRTPLAKGPSRTGGSTYPLSRSYPPAREGETLPPLPPSPEPTPLREGETPTPLSRSESEVQGVLRTH